GPQRIELFQHVGYQRGELGHCVEVALERPDTASPPEVAAAEAPFGGDRANLAEGTLAHVMDHPLCGDGTGAGQLVDTQCGVVQYRALQRLLVSHLNSPCRRADRR